MTRVCTTGLTFGCFFTGKGDFEGLNAEEERPGGSQAAECLKGTARLWGLGKGLYKRRVLIIQKAHHKTSIFRDNVMRLQFPVGVPKRIKTIQIIC